jgi:hypothetical protein
MPPSVGRSVAAGFWRRSRQALLKQTHAFAIPCTELMGIRLTSSKMALRSSVEPGLSRATAKPSPALRLLIAAGVYYVSLTFSARGCQGFPGSNVVISNAPVVVRKCLRVNISGVTPLRCDEAPT